MTANDCNYSFMENACVSQFKKVIKKELKTESFNFLKELQQNNTEVLHIKYDDCPKNCCAAEEEAHKDTQQHLPDCSNLK